MSKYRFGTLLIDPYWIGFYVTSYGDHYRRRALIGTLCRLVAPHGISVLAINIVAIVVLCSLIFLLIKAWQHLELDNTFRGRLFTFAFFAAPFIGLLWEVLGDTLQIAFLLFSAVLLLARDRIENRAILVALGAVLICLAFFIHEASIFFLAPVLPFFLQRKPQPRDFIIPTVLLGALVLLSAAWSHVQPNLTYSAILFPQHGHFADPIETPDFKTLILLEKQEDFSSKRATIHFGIKILRIAALAFVGLIALVTAFSRSGFERFIATLACTGLYCLPLFVIAHDWGRFLCYAFMLAILAAAIPFSKIDLHEENNSMGWSSRAALRLRAMSNSTLLQMATLFVLLEKPGLPMRLRGVSSRELVTLIALGLIAFVTYRAKSRDLHEASSEPGW